MLESRLSEEAAHWQFIGRILMLTIDAQRSGVIQIQLSEAFAESFDLIGIDCEMEGEFSVNFQVTSDSLQDFNKDQNF